MRRVVFVQLAALVVVLCGFAPWLAGVSGWDLAAAVWQAGGDVDGLPAAWLGWAWYLLPVLAFAAWLSLYLPRTPPRHVGLALGIAVVLFSLGFRIAAQAADADAGWGVYLAFFVGVALIVVDRVAAETRSGVQTTPTTF
jgi:hypothetical protein